MKTLNDNIKPILAVIIVVLCFTYFFISPFIPKSDPQTLIAIVSVLSAATGYYFGSSSGSQKKDDTIATTLSNATPPVSVSAPIVDAPTK